MFKVGIIGPESTGKSSLALYLSKRYKGTYVPEYARTYVETRKHTPTPSPNEGELQRDNQPYVVSWDELCEIAHHQIEEIISYSNLPLEDSQIVFFDTELIVTKVWFDYAFGRVPEWLNEAIIAYPMDVYLLTYPDIDWQQDGARYNGSDAMRKELFDRYEQEIQALNIPYYIITHKGTSMCESVKQ